MLPGVILGAKMIPDVLTVSWRLSVLVSVCQAPRKKEGRLASYYIQSLLLPLPAAASRSCRKRAAACLIEQKKNVFCDTIS